ncbi:hypothetical protein CAPTEDRAFT_146759, partial [Capitella teleta]
NKLSMNISKTESMIFHQPKKNVNPPNIIIDCTVIENVDDFVYLGITINKHLSWKSHTRNIACKISKVNCILARN